MKIGIFVGRFQAPKLHNGYKYMLSELQISYDYYGLIVGSSIEPNDRNPLDFETRKSMLEEYVYKQPLFIIEFVDLNDNDKWTKELDMIINDSIAKTCTQVNKDDIYLIGSRDSFIPYYNGEYKTLELEQYGKYNSTELRTGIKLNPISFNFILGFAYKWIEKNWRFRFKCLKPVGGYNLNWSMGYIYFSNK
jgi:bifunctional NMN adenylyltransferase/nudix hydrolase